ncbi:MAG: hypothetical protein ACJ77B_12415 [Chloroflexota bacterium]
MSFPAALTMSRPRAVFTARVTSRQSTIASLVVAAVVAAIAVVAVAPALAQSAVLIAGPAVLLGLAAGGSDSPTIDTLRIVNGVPAPLR